MVEKIHSEFEAQDYQYMPILKKITFSPNDPFIKKLFQHNPELLKELESIHILAHEERESFKDWSELEEYELIKRRVTKRRKSAWFFIFIRYNFKDFRGYTSSRACTGHTVLRFIYGKESQEMLRTIEDSWKSVKKSNMKDEF